MNDPRIVFEAVLAVAGFLSAFWLKAIRQDIHDLVVKVADHGERLAVMESRVGRLEANEGRVFGSSGNR